MSNDTLFKARASPGQAVVSGISPNRAHPGVMVRQMEPHLSHNMSAGPVMMSPLGSDGIPRSTVRHLNFNPLPAFSAPSSDATFHLTQPPGFSPSSHLNSPPGKALARGGGTRLVEALTPQKKCRQCNCKNSRCLKLYCECFAAGIYCEGCNCVNCCNNAEYETVRRDAVEATLERNPNAFRPKIASGPLNSTLRDQRADAESAENPVAGRHNKGCHCKKSGCLKKYCECFQAGILCSENCKCIDCKNFDHSDEGRGGLYGDMSVSQAVAAGGTSSKVPYSSPSPPPSKKPRISERAYAPSAKQPSLARPATSPMLSGRGANQVISSADAYAYTAATNQTHPLALCAGQPTKSLLAGVVKPDAVQDLCRLLAIVATELAKGGAAERGFVLSDMPAAGAAEAERLAEKAGTKGTRGLQPAAVSDPIARGGTAAQLASRKPDPSLGQASSGGGSGDSVKPGEQRQQDQEQTTDGQVSSGAAKMAGQEEPEVPSEGQSATQEVSGGPEDGLEEDGLGGRKRQGRAMSPGTLALMCDEEDPLVANPSPRLRDGKSRGGRDYAAELYAEQERVVLEEFNECLKKIISVGRKRAAQFAAELNHVEYHGAVHPSLPPGSYTHANGPPMYVAAQSCPSLVGPIPARPGGSAMDARRSGENLGVGLHPGGPNGHVQNSIR